MRAYQGEGRRLWALAVQLYALRSRRNWGIGDFSDLADPDRARCRARRRGHRPQSAARAVCRPRRGGQPLRPQQPAVPQSALHRRRGDPGISTAPPNLRPRSQRCARASWSTIRARRRGETRALCGWRIERSARPRVARAAPISSPTETSRAKRCCALPASRCCAGNTRRRRGGNGRKPWRNPGRAQLEEFRRAHDEDCEFPEFVQWTADRQLAGCVAAARRHGMPIGLYVDLAVGIDPRRRGRLERPARDAGRCFARRAARRIQSAPARIGVWRRSIRTRCRTSDFAHDARN